MKAIPVNMLLGAVSGRAWKNRRTGSGGLDTFAGAANFYSLVQGGLLKSGISIAPDAGPGIRIDGDAGTLHKKAVSGSVDLTCCEGPEINTPTGSPPFKCRR